MIAGYDVSSWQDPEKWDWPALALGDKFVIARACYGTKPDRAFARYAALCREHGICFGAYLFYRQTQTVTDQFAVWNRQLAAIGGLREGDLLPTLDMEENRRNGDGRPNPARFGAACREIAEALRAEHGGAVLYYSSFFPDYLGAPKTYAHVSWMRESGYYHWLADYGSKTGPTPLGQPRTPYTAVWHLHQAKARPVPEYAGGGADVDANALNPKKAIADLLIQPAPELSEDAVLGEEGTTERPGGCDDEERDRGIALVSEGLDRIREGLDALEKAQKVP